MPYETTESDKRYWTDIGVENEKRLVQAALRADMSIGDLESVAISKARLKEMK